MYFSLKQKNENIGGVSFGIFSFVHNNDNDYCFK